jgi:oligopeptide transport system permease protein
METINTPEATGMALPIATEVPEELQEQSVSPFQAAFKRFMRDWRAVTSLAIILIIVVGSFVFPLIYHHLGPTLKGGVGGNSAITPAQYHTPVWQELSRSDGPSTMFPLGPNSWAYPLGTDTNGRDILARLMAGVNVSIIIALSVEVFDIGLGLLFGTLAGFFGGWLDTVLARFTDIMFAFPGLLLIILVGASLGPIFDQLLPHGPGRVVLLIASIGFLAWPLMMRYVRGQTLQLKEQQFIEAARTVGTSNAGIIVRHIVPNLLSIVIVASTLNILGTIVLEAGISVLGVGIQPPNTSLGLMISESLSTIYTSWTEVFWPGITLVILVICFAFVGDGLQTAFDPRSKD